MKQKKLVIIGAGETANLAFHYFQNDSEYEVVAFAVEKKYIENTTFQGLPVTPFEQIKDLYSPSEYEVFVATSSTSLSKLRTRLYLECKEMGYHMASYISTSAYVGYNAKIGENCFIMENNTIQPFVTIGNNVTLWSGNHIGHQSVIGDHSFLTSHVVVSGFCHIGRNCFLGVNSCVSEYRTIGNYCLIGMGSVVGKDMKDYSIVKSQYAKMQPINTKQFFNL